MQRLRAAVILGCFLSLITSPNVVAEQMCITTYYPSPNGSYDALTVKRLSVGDTNGDGAVNASDVPSSNGYLLVKDKLGIGTSAPTASLQILSTTGPQFRIQYPGGNDPFSIYVDESTSNSVKVWLSPGDDFDASSANDYLVIGDYATATEKFWFRGDGASYFSKSVGIGTAGGTVPLTVMNPSTTSGVANLVNVANYSGHSILCRYNYDNGYWQFRTSGCSHPINFSMYDTSVLWLGTSGNVGIGTTSPGEKLEVNGKIVADPNYATAIRNTSFTTTSSSFVDVPGLSVSLTTHGKPVLITVNINYNPAGGSAGWGKYTIIRDSTNLGNATYGLQIAQGSSSSHNVPVTMVYVDVPSAGAHTYKVRVSSGRGTVEVCETGQVAQIAAIELN